MAIGSILFSIVVICLELYAGCAVIGWTGDRMVVERDKSPGPYWFAIILHCFVAIGISALFFVAS